MKRLVLDVADWTAAGEALLEVDPGRFAAILTVVQDLIDAHRNPLGKSTADVVVAAVGAKRGVA